jgi:uncharacterized protein
MRNKLWIIGGSICVGLGIVGIFLPVLPTTPFLLLAAFCYGRGSERFYHWLVNRSRLGSYIRDYREGRGLPLMQKLLTIALLWLTMGFTIGFVATTWWLKTLLVLVALVVTLHLIRIKTRRPEPPKLADKEKSLETIDVT